MDGPMLVRARPPLPRSGRSGCLDRRHPALILPSGARLLGYARLGIRILKVAVAVRRSASNVDRVVVNGLLGLPAVALARPRSPVVYLVHEVIRRPDRAGLLRRLRGTVDATIAISSAGAAALADIGLDALVVPNGTPWPVRPAPPLPPTPPVVGCVASLTVGKGQHVLLEALSLLERSDVVVEFVGEHCPRMWTTPPPFTLGPTPLTCVAECGSRATWPTRSIGSGRGP